MPTISEQARQVLGSSGAARKNAERALADALDNTGRSGDAVLASQVRSGSQARRAAAKQAARLRGG